MRKLLIILVALLAVGAGYYWYLASTGAPAALRIATEGANPPFNFIDKDGQAAGFDVDIAKALCAKAKFDCEIGAQDWDGIIPGLLAKKYDAIIASMSIASGSSSCSVGFSNATGL